MLRIGICDDQPEWAELLRQRLYAYLEQRKLEASITVFASAEELLHADWQAFHILFLDVVLGKQDGVKLATQIRCKNSDLSLIFVSAYLDYATMGYQVKASAYLLKKNLAATLDAAMDAVLRERQLDQNVIDITVEGHSLTLRLRSILYIESMGKSAKLHGSTDYKTPMRLSSLEKILAPKGFLRIHRCYIVNMAHCVTIKNYCALLDNGEVLPCSRQEYRDLVHSLVRWKGMNL